MNGCGTSAPGLRQALIAKFAFLLTAELKSRSTSTYRRRDTPSPADGPGFELVVPQAGTPRKQLAFDAVFLQPAFGEERLGVSAHKNDTPTGYWQSLELSTMPLRQLLVPRTSVTYLRRHRDRAVGESRM